MSALKLALNSPARDQICKNLTFEEAIRLRTALKLPSLKCPVFISDPDSQINSLPEVNDFTSQIYLEIQKHGSIQTFLNAAKNNQLKQVQMFLQLGMPINITDPNGDTILMTAADSGKPEIVEFLLNYQPTKVQPTQVQIDAQNKQGRTALHLAVFNGSTEIFKILLAAGADPKIEDRTFKNALMIAVRQGFLEIVKILLEIGMDPNFQNQIWTAPHLAVSANRVQILQVLLAAGADPNLALNDGITLLMSAAMAGHANIVRVLIKAGANIGALNQSGLSAVFYAVVSGYPEVVRELLLTGVDPNLVTVADNRNTLLMSAIRVTPRNINQTDSQNIRRKDYEETVRILIEAGANVNEISPNQWTPIVTAASFGLTKIIQYLISAGAQVNAQNGEGITSLMFAAQDGNVEMAKMLLAAGADVGIIENAQGYTALMISAGNRHKEVFNELLNATYQQYGYLAYIKALQYKPVLYLPAFG